MDMVLSIIGWILFGLIVGAVARLLVPGRDPMGWIATIALGIIGSLVGGAVGYAIWGGEYAPGGWILAIIGGVLSLVLYNWAVRKRAAP